MGLGTWEADGSGEDTDIVPLHREVSTSLIRYMCAFEEIPSCETYAAENDGCKKLSRKTIGQDEFKKHF